MGREVRKVSADWKHPVNGAGDLIPLLDGSFKESENEWEQGWKHWSQGRSYSWKTKQWEQDVEDTSLWAYEDDNGRRPTPSDYMPVFEDPSHFAFYENVSEGTPLSPPMVSIEELARWLTDHPEEAHGDYTYEQWLATCEAGWCPSMVILSSPEGTKFLDGPEVALENV